MDSVTAKAKQAKHKPLTKDRLLAYEILRLRGINADLLAALLDVRKIILDGDPVDTVEPWAQEAVGIIDAAIAKAEEVQQ